MVKISDTLPGEFEVLLLIMSNGNFDGLCEKLVKRLSKEMQVPSEAKTR